MNRYQIGWLKDLRDPDALQATGSFRVTKEIEGVEGATPVGDCCLGIYCERVYPDSENWVFNDSVYIDAIDNGEGVLMEVTLMQYSLTLDNGTDSFTVTLPQVDLERLGLTAMDTNVLANFNDSERIGFDGIADILEHTFRDGSIDVITAAQELGYLELFGIRLTNYEYYENQANGGIV